MARYFFDLIEGSQTVADDVGTVLENDDSATRFAWRTLAACVSEPGSISPWEHAQMEVRREDGAHVGRVSMTIEVEGQKPVANDARWLREG